MTYGELTLKQVSDICEAHQCNGCPFNNTICSSGHFTRSGIHMLLDTELEFKKKYVCLNCGRTFDEPYEWEDHVGDYWGQPAYEHHSSCPYCKEDEIVTEEDLLNENCDL